MWNFGYDSKGEIHAALRARKFGFYKNKIFLTSYDKNKVLNYLYW